MAKKLTTKHGNPAAMCDLCDPPRPFSKAYMSVHRRKAHQSRVGQRSFTTRSVPALTSVKEMRVSAGFAPLPAEHANGEGYGNGEVLTYRELPRFRVLECSDGGLWIAERMR